MEYNPYNIISLANKFLNKHQRDYWKAIGEVLEDKRIPNDLSSAIVSNLYFRSMEVEANIVQI